MALSCRSGPSEARRDHGVSVERGDAPDRCAHPAVGLSSSAATTSTRSPACRRVSLSSTSVGRDNRPRQVPPGPAQGAFEPSSSHSRRPSRAAAACAQQRPEKQPELDGCSGCAGAPESWWRPITTDPSTCRITSGGCMPGVKQIGLQIAHCGSGLRPSRRVGRVLHVTAAGRLSLLPAVRPIVLHPVRDRLLCLG